MTSTETANCAVDETTTHTATSIDAEPVEDVASQQETIIEKDVDALVHDETALSPPPEEEVYTVFPISVRRAICAAATLSILLSPFATSIYFPSISLIAKDLGVSVEKIDLTVTTYMIFQGVSPTFWASLADATGRRPVYLGCITVFVIANLCLALQHTYVGLLVLRMLQSAGSSATVAIGAGTVADITVPADRGFWMGLLGAGSTVAPAVAPVLGGVLSLTKESWRASFWLLFAAGAVLLVALVLWMPETGRMVVGNGSIAPRGVFNRPLLDVLLGTRRHGYIVQGAELPRAAGRRLPNPLRCVKILVQKDVATVLVGHALVYAAFYAVTIGFSSQLPSVYGLSTLKTGLCFLPFGFGVCVGSIGGGKVLDKQFRQSAARAGYTDPRAVRQDPDFPLEHARLRLIWYPIIVCAVLSAAFGWSFRRSATLAAPLVLIGAEGGAMGMFFTTVQVLLVDLYPQESASVTAANNLVRCLLGAGASAVVEAVIEKVGMGWTYVIVAGMQLLSLPLFAVEYTQGGRWRRERFARVEAAKAAKEAKLAAKEEQEK
ncbi:major facilitator superfamily domain-containing protein [Limtongia smithiae]|uniref:major facilitator superfamily domain-containing protein n=1 Tax=Limtongia smithiae TaxID=1125753 RepID=UPI0034CD2B76